MLKPSTLTTNLKFSLIDGVTGSSMYIVDNFNPALSISSYDISGVKDNYLTFDTASQAIKFNKTVNFTGGVANFQGPINAFNAVNFFTGPVAFNSIMTINSTVNSNQYGNGALIVQGGLYTAKDLYVLGNAFKPGSQVWTVISDKRVKEEIEDVDIQKCIDSIQNFKIKNYKFRDEYRNLFNLPDKQQIGVIADDVYETHPDMVNLTSIQQLGIEDFKTINMGDQIYEIIACLQFLLKENKRKDEEIQKLKTKL